MIDLGTLGGPDSVSDAVAVNDSGQVVGHFTRPDNQHAFSWTPDGGMVELPSLGEPGTSAEAVNANGQVVGSSNTADGLRPVLWQPCP
jgi:probable HAF family extracellular repeat protein